MYFCSECGNMYYIKIVDKLIYYCGKRGGQYLGASYVQKATEDFARIIEEEQDRDLLHKSRISKRNLVAESRLPLEKQGGIKYALSIHDKVPVPNLGTRFLKRRVSAYIRDSKTGEMKRHTSSLPYNAELTLVKRVARYYQVHAHGKTLYLKTALRNFSKDELPPKNLKKSMDYIIGDSIALGTRSFCNYGEGFHGQRIQYIADILLGRLDNDKIAQDTVSIVCGFNDLPRIKSVDDMRAIYEPLLKAVRLAVSKGKSVKLCGLYRNRSTRRVNHLIEPINDYLKSVCDSMNGVEYVDVFDLNNGRGALHDAKIYNKIAERLT